VAGFLRALNTLPFVTVSDGGLSKPVACRLVTIKSVQRQRHLNFRALVVAFAVLLLATACGSSTTETTATVPQAEAEAGPSLLTGEFAAVTGDSIDLADLEGENVVFWFWEPF